MTTPKKPRVAKKAKVSEIPQIKKTPRPDIAGQVKHNSVKDALRSVTETLGILHIQTHDKLKAR